MQNNITARALYDRSRTVLFNYWIKDRTFAGDVSACNAYIDTMRLTQSYLRMELALTTTTTNYVFAVTPQQKGGAVTFNTEQLLNLQDSFVINEMFLGIGLPSSATDPTFQPKTFMNSLDTNAVAMQGWWTGGVFSLQVNNETIIPAWDVVRHFYIPQTQATTFVASTQTGPASSPQDQKRLGEDGFYPMEPNCLLIGSKNSRPIVTLPLALTAVTASSRAILVVRGVLAQNSTVVS